MRFLNLYFRSREIPRAALIILALVPLFAIWGWHFGETGEKVGTRFFPLLPAVIIGASFASDLAWTGSLSARRLWTLRLLQAGALVALAAAGMALAFRIWWEPGTTSLALRNLVLYTSATLLLAPLVGPRLSWAGPFTLLSVGIMPIPRTWDLAWLMDVMHTPLGWDRNLAVVAVLALAAGASLVLIPSLTRRRDPVI